MKSLLQLTHRCRGNHGGRHCDGNDARRRRSSDSDTRGRRRAAGRANPVHALRHLLRRHQLRRRRRPLSRASQEPLVRVPRAAHGLATAIAERRPVRGPDGRPGRTATTRTTCASRSTGRAVIGVSNEGYRGIGVRRARATRISFVARAATGAPVRSASSLQDTSGKHQLGARRRSDAGVDVDAYGRRSRRSDQHRAPARGLRRTARARSTWTWSRSIPTDTCDHRENGLRADLVQLLKDMHPGFLRFPGGCIVEGRYLEGRYQWKTTIGDTSERKLLVNRWNDEFSSRAAPDYYQSFGLGFYEYFQLAEDIGASPLPILNCGMACQFNSGELAPLDQIDPYIQDALDLIEFANGPATTPGARSAPRFGHPAPFNMKMLGVGNEQWGPQYLERYAKFKKVLEVETPGDSSRGERRSVHRARELQDAVGRPARDRRRLRGRALLPAARLVLHATSAATTAIRAPGRRSSSASTPRTLGRGDRRDAAEHAGRRHWRKRRG